jgi:hypothetical protein
MRWDGREIPGEYIPLVLHLKTLSHALREQIAKDLICDSDCSVATTTLFEEDEDKEPRQLSDVERWVSGLEDEFEPVPQVDDEFDENVSVQTKSSRIKGTKAPSTPKVIERILPPLR